MKPIAIVMPLDPNEQWYYEKWCEQRGTCTRVTGYDKSRLPTTDRELHDIQAFFSEKLSFRGDVLYVGDKLAAEQGDGYRNVLHVCTLLLEESEDTLYFQFINDRRRLLEPIRRLGRDRDIVIETTDEILIGRLLGPKRFYHMSDDGDILEMK